MTTPPTTPADVEAIRERWKRIKASATSSTNEWAQFALNAHADIAALLGEVERLKNKYEPRCRVCDAENATYHGADDSKVCKKCFDERNEIFHEIFNESEKDSQHDPR